MDKAGNKLDEIKTDVSSVSGYHAVTDDGDLLYIDQSNNSIKKYTPDRKTTTVIRSTGNWSPCSVYSSHRTGDILVGMIAGSRKLVRYNKEGRELWQSQYDAQGQPLYRFPKYITENVNSDICTSDGFGDNPAVVVVDRDGNHRFSYRGRQDGSGFSPWGICTDAHGRILVVVNDDSVHMIDQNGEFITVLLTKDHGISGDWGLCTDSDNNIWLCGLRGVKMYKYLN
jgi:sugar lactone lactonase YvrE